MLLELNPNDKFGVAEGVPVVVVAVPVEVVLPGPIVLPDPDDVVVDAVAEDEYQDWVDWLGYG